MARFIQEGKTIDYTNGGAEEIKYGDVVSEGGKVFVAMENIPVGATGGLRAEGVFEFRAETTAAFVVGDTLYWDKAAQKATKTSTSNTLLGFAVYAKAQATATCIAKLK